MASLNGGPSTDLSYCESSHSKPKIYDSYSESEKNDSNEKKYSSPDDSMCGEPFAAQHIILDFTPKLEEDNEYVQKKCCAFWDFINSVPEIQNLMVQSIKVPSSHGTLETIPSVPTQDTPPEIPEPTAHSVLDLLNDKGVSDLAFGSKLPNIACLSFHSKEDKLEKRARRTQHAKKTKGYKAEQKPHILREASSSEERYQRKHSPASLTSMIKKMEQWDATHPKSMKPPGHPPLDKHCVLQSHKTKSQLTLSLNRY